MMAHVIGVGLIVYGVSTIYLPAGFIAAGVALWWEAHGAELINNRATGDD